MLIYILDLPVGLSMNDKPDSRVIKLNKLSMN